MRSGMKDENKKETNNEKKINYLPTKFSLIIRSLVALYLLHIVYSLRDVTEKYTGKELFFFIAAIGAFGVIAVVLIIHSGRALIKGRYIGGAMDESKEEPEESPPNHS